MTSIVTRLRQIGQIDRTLADEVRRSLVETLFASSTSLGAGAMAGASVSAAVALATGDPWIRATAVAIAAVGALRMCHAVFHTPRRKGEERSIRAEVGYELGAMAFSALLGLVTLLCLLRSDNVLHHLLTVTVSVGYAAGISGRNAGRPVIAIGQLALATLPVAIGLFLSGDPLRWVLGIVTIVFMIGMLDITLQTYSAVLKAMSATHEQKRLTARFERLARFDTMTGLENRGAFQERLQAEVAAVTSADGEQLAVLWIDLDKFKEINDSLGHPTGDKVLCQMARQLTSIVDGRGSVARFGGDEFVLLARGGKEGFAEDLAREVMRGMAMPMNIEGVSIQVTGSIGVALAPRDGRDSETLLQHADMALYHAKDKGRNDYCQFEQSMEEEFLELRKLEAALRVAIEREELEVFYQPIVDLKSGDISCCEALLRWHHPEYGSISPARFIPIAENTGLISPISHWVLGQACEAAASWPEGVSVAVNMSPALLKDLHLPHMILSTLYTTGLPARRLELEITESVLLEDNVQSNSLIKEFQKIGLKLSLDDFGTGYSSLAYLKKYRFNKIKIDTSFIADVTRSKEARAIIHALVGLAAELDMEIVAEGIETETQLAYVTGARCTAAQGFYLGRPAPRDVIGRRLAAQERGERWTGKEGTEAPRVKLKAARG